MKKFTFLFTFLTITLSFGQELLSNGGFEGLPVGDVTLSTSPWESPNGNNNPGKVKIVNDQALAQEGEQFLFFDNDFRNIRQAFTAVQGTEYTLTFWNHYVSNQGQPDATDGTYISIRQPNGGNGAQFDPPIQIYIDPSTVDSNWNEFNLNFMAPQSDLILYVFKQSRVSGGPNNAARMDGFSISHTLSVNDLAQFKFKLSPNPTKDYLQLSAVKNIDRIEVFNLLGQQISSRELELTQTQLDVSTLSKGIYILKAHIEDAVGSYKFVKH